VSLAWGVGLTVVLGGAPPAAAGSRAPSALAGWREVWRDDFDGPAGSRLDPGSWQYDLGHCYQGCPAQNWGTGEVAEMTDSTDNVALDGLGHLLITPRRGPDGRWTSGRLESKRADFAAAADGALRVEARLALPAVAGPAAQGYWSAFWMLGAAFRNGFVDPTGAGDVDVMEHVDTRPETVGAVHCQPVGAADPCQEVPDNVGLAGTTTCPPAGCLNGFHTYTVELHRESSPQRLDWLIDGAVYHSVPADQPGMDPTTWQLLITRSFFLILNQSIGGTWPGAPTAQTQDGVPLVVDYVAVWVTAADQHDERECDRSDRSDDSDHGDDGGRSDRSGRDAGHPLDHHVDHHVDHRVESGRGRAATVRGPSRARASSH